MNFKSNSQYYSLVVIFSLCCLLSLNSQTDYEINKDYELTGVYSAVIKKSKKAKGKLTNVYIYTHKQYDIVTKHFCLIEQYQSKKEKGQPSIIKYFGAAIYKGNKEYSISLERPFDVRRPAFIIKKMIFKDDGSVLIEQTGKKNVYNAFIEGVYQEKIISQDRFNSFLDSFYSNILSNFSKGNKLTWGVHNRLNSNRKKTLFRVDLSSEVPVPVEIHNAETFSLIYKGHFDATYSSGYIHKALEKSNIKGFSKLIEYFPNLKALSVFNDEKNMITHNINIKRKNNKFLYSVNAVSTVLTQGYNERYLEQKKREDKIKTAEIRTQKEKERISKIYELHNPANITLIIDKKPKGRRYEAAKVLLGEEVNNELTKYFESAFNGLTKPKGFKRLDAIKYFKDLFYGNFEDMKPSKVSKNMLGMSLDYFPDFYNAFLYYTYEKYGNSYYPNMSVKTFKMIRDEFKNGNKTSSIDTNFIIYLPKIMKPKFETYLDKNQFSISGEEFFVDFEYLILSFLDNYDPNSLAFKQMFQNLYRYSNKLKPLTKLDEIKKL